MNRFFNIKKSIEYCLLIGAAFMFPFFFIDSPSYYASPIIKGFWNLGHVLFFAITSYGLLKLATNKPVIWRTLLIVIFTVVMGGGIESIQLKIGREFSWHDVYLDLLGGLFALSFSSIIPNKIHRFLAIASVVILILAEQVTLYRAIAMEFHQYQKFPVLASFQVQKDLAPWYGNEIYINDDYNLAVRLSKGKEFSGFSLRYFPSNWQGYRKLNISLLNSYDEELILNIKITDWQHDEKKQAYNNRYNTQVKLKTGWNQISLPLAEVIQGPKNREMDIKNISRISFFMTNLADDKVLYIEQIILEK